MKKLDHEKLLPVEDGRVVRQKMFANEAKLYLVKIITALIENEIFDFEIKFLSRGFSTTAHVLLKHKITIQPVSTVIAIKHIEVGGNGELQLKLFASEDALYLTYITRMTQAKLNKILKPIPPDGTI